MKHKKSRRFFLLLPIIEQLIHEGYTQQSIVEKLKMDHELDLSLNTFKSYLYRYSSKNGKAQENSNLDSKKPEYKSSFLSQFSDVEKQDDPEPSSIMSLIDRQKGIKGDISKSRAKAKELLKNAEFDLKFK